MNNICLLGADVFGDDNNTLQSSLVTPGRGSYRGRGGRGGPWSRGQAISRGRGGASRGTKRARPQLEDPGESAGEDRAGPAKRKGKKRQTRIAQPTIAPAEVHRRKTSLRDRLIKGDYEPQTVGMRAYKLSKAADATAAATEPGVTANPPNPPREFLTPAGPSQNTAETELATHNQTPTGLQPSQQVADENTPIYQIHFPEALLLALKQNEMKWTAKTHSESSVFVVVRLVDGDIMDMRVFSTLRDATSDALHMITTEHPETFALPRENDGEGRKVKLERTESASSVMRQITARPDFEQIQVPRETTEQHDATEADADGDSLFVIKSEDDELPRPLRIPEPQPDVNNRGEILLGNAPEPAYVFWGSYKIVSFGLKMEAQRTDGVTVKVSVHLKNLRKPVHT
ncbi:hypothetical protein F5Y19DRAFT_488159 [Xylariaceae sp. FL1651]|nr:hypothetical protein F5Y19DRAFT_488159 [Xylariaceae sp. FL1651]